MGSFDLYRYVLGNPGGNRFEDAEIEWLKEFTAENSETQVPVIVILTQALNKKNTKELKSMIESENLDIVRVVPVLAKDMDIDEEYVARSYGLDKLIEVMSSELPGELQTTLQAVQKVSLEAKKKQSRIVINTAVGAATAAGAVPIPFSDAAVLVPIQVAMIARITVIFGIHLEDSVLSGIIASLTGCAGATVAGRLIVGLLKCIPGVGTVLGGAISAGTAALLTKALGEAYVSVMEDIFTGKTSEEELSTEAGKEKMKKIFMESLKNAKESDG